ncbi:MAG TPA: alpha/beta hydrolase [Alphaproteobacteria bacterium]|nr:alpha/beta hydrolase [Alphaproteobacteria bacterium]
MKVFLDYDQDQLDAQYDNMRAVPDHARWTDRWPGDSAAVRASLECRLDVPYAAGPRRTLDIFPARGSGNPVMLFIHGGWWRSRTKEDFSFVVPNYVAAGIATVMVEYPLLPSVTLDVLVECARESVEWVWRNAASFGADPARLHVTGHSAGGHLTAMMMSTGWAARGLPPDVVKSGAALSGLYELEPIRRCYINADARLDAAGVERNSPIAHLPTRSAPLILAVGGKETDEFRRQQDVYAKAWHRAGLPLAIVALPEDQHYSILESFKGPAGPLFEAVKRQIFGA